VEVEVESVTDVEQEADKLLMLAPQRQAGNGAPKAAGQSPRASASAAASTSTPIISALNTTTGTRANRSQSAEAAELGLEPPPIRAKLTLWLKRPLLEAAQAAPMKTLVRRLRPAPGQVLKPQQFIMHLSDFDDKAVLLAEGQAAIDQFRLLPTHSPTSSSSSATWQIYVGFNGGKGQSVAALKRVVSGGSPEKVYQLLYCDDTDGTCA
jgi:hypothetical protein